MTKFSALLLCAAASVSAADFRTGQGARASIGQPTFTSQIPGTSQSLLNGVGGLAYANDTLFVVDSNRVNATNENNRVMIYKGISGMIPAVSAAIPPYSGTCPVCTAQATNVLGQPNYSYGGINGTTGTDTSGNPIGLTAAISATGMRTPTSVATDGQILAVADADNNRVLIWNSIPSSIQTPADVVVGQQDFSTNTPNWQGTITNPSAQGLRNPQGVSIANGKLLVADTQNNRILIWNSVPKQNGQAADQVVGQTSFTAFVDTNLALSNYPVGPADMIAPVSATVDPANRLIVSDLGFNRVLIWNSFPSGNGAAADIALGQPDMYSRLANNVTAMCASTGTATDGTLTYPDRCAGTMDSPRYAMSDGTRLFVSDGGNDRVLIWNTFPTNSGQRADVILGQADAFSVVSATTDFLGQSTYNPDQALPSVLLTPMQMAWDGSTNLYVSDPYNRRVLVFSPAESEIFPDGVRNAASRNVHAVGSIIFSGTITAGEVIDVTIDSTEYKYTEATSDTLTTIVNSIVSLINAGSGDPNVIATPNDVLNQVVLTARPGGADGNDVTYSVTVTPKDSTTAATITATPSGTSLKGGQDAAKIAPGSLVTFLGHDFTDHIEAAPADADPLPRTLAGVEVYFNGIPAPLLFASPVQINAQIPWDVVITSGVTAWVRTTYASGVVVSVPVGVSIVDNNPGIFARDGTDPRAAIALHGSSSATGLVSIDGTIKAGDVGTITIASANYTYTVQASDTLDSVRDAFIAEINATDPIVEASASGFFHRILLTAKTPGPEANGTAYSASVTTGSSLVMSGLTSFLCCASNEGALVTTDNPLIPGETFILWGTGLGTVNPIDAQLAAHTGQKYQYPGPNSTNTQVDALAGGKTANLIYAGLEPGTVGIYRVRLQLNPDLPTNPLTQVTIAQYVYVSNIVTVPINAPVVPSSIVCSPTTVTSSNTSTCTLTINTAAPEGGSNVPLTSSSASLTVPASVLVPQSATTVNFTATAGIVTASTSATITATSNYATATATITVNP